MKRGHVRPVGSTTRMRMFDMTREPLLGSYTYDAPVERERGYRIVGVEEVGRPGRWNLVLERVAWSEVLAHEAEVEFAIVPRP